MRPPPPDDWPFAAQSQIIEARPHRWHVQQLGAGPDLVLLHGAGASTHSWRALAPLLADGYRITMLDLPGHGFTRSDNRSRAGLDPMAEDVARLLHALAISPAAYLGHSAGATVALRLALDGARPTPVLSINGAFQMFEGIAGFLFPLMAKALAFNPLTVPLFTAGSSLPRTRRMLAGTGSTIEDAGLRQYHALISDREHVAGALAMMANWSLDRLIRDAPGLDAPALLVVGANDRTVPTRVSRDMADRLQQATLTELPGVGHLLHEEAAHRAAEVCLTFLDTALRVDGTAQKKTPG
ncbi:magnesium chelatase [Jannaschia pagri]|uniref:Magnesium chelatase n=1 Tax=Jannaschia pagri TaxID=2829797 RepID=A0ABQ4NM69_9RHOB|nr:MULTISPECIES: alpha/beta fold hydrolase BchO [unclassified Jannaschia]GIT91368.1 magnesium chelatase [Jannaschia sp. AI_61]GIT95202.1 magnesium chelatase [Jannaschia sp. AI_62]